jgi:hypothetical protein
MIDLLNLLAVDKWLAHSLPGEAFKDVYGRGMRRLAEHGFFRGQHVVRTRFGFEMEVDRLDAIKWWIYYFGCFEPVTKGSSRAGRAVL